MQFYALLSKFRIIIITEKKSDLSPQNFQLANFPMSIPHSHCLGMNYYVNFLGGIGSNGFHIKLIFGTQGNWKNQNPWGRFGATS